MKGTVILTPCVLCLVSTWLYCALSSWMYAGRQCLCAVIPMSSPTLLRHSTISLEFVKRLKEREVCRTWWQRRTVLDPVHRYAETLMPYLGRQFSPKKRRKKNPSCTAAGEDVRLYVQMLQSRTSEKF